MKPPKDRLIKDFTLNWRPNSDIVYVFETEPSGYFGPILGMYEKQTVTHNKMFLYRQVWKRNETVAVLRFFSPRFPSPIPEAIHFSWRFFFLGVGGATRLCTHARTHDHFVAWFFVCQARKRSVVGGGHRTHLEACSLLTLDFFC